jgi:hypothetical protein
MNKTIRKPVRYSVNPPREDAHRSPRELPVRWTAEVIRPAAFLSCCYGLFLSQHAKQLAGHVPIEWADGMMVSGSSRVRLRRSGICAGRRLANPGRAALDDFLYQLHADFLRPAGIAIDERGLAK